jgi:hypothetical protein
MLALDLGVLIFRLGSYSKSIPSSSDYRFVSPSLPRSLNSYPIATACSPQKSDESALVALLQRCPQPLRSGKIAKLIRLHPCDSIASSFRDAVLLFEIRRPSVRYSVILPSRLFGQVEP